MKQCGCQQQPRAIRAHRQCPFLGIGRRLGERPGGPSAANRDGAPSGRSGAKRSGRCGRASPGRRGERGRAPREAWRPDEGLEDALRVLKQRRDRAACGLWAANAHQVQEAAAECAAWAIPGVEVKEWLCAATASWASTRKRPPRSAPERRTPSPPRYRRAPGRRGACAARADDGRSRLMAGALTCHSVGLLHLRREAVNDGDSHLVGSTCTLRCD